MCDHLWTVVCSASRAETSSLRHNPVERCCLVNLSETSIRRLMVAYSSYHALRMDYRVMIDQAVASDNYDEVLETLRLLSLHFAGVYSS